MPVLPIEIVEKIMSYNTYNEYSKICTLSKEHLLFKDILLKQVLEEYEKIKNKLYTCKLYLNLCTSTRISSEHCQRCYNPIFREPYPTHFCNITKKEIEEFLKNVKLMCGLEKFLHKNKKYTEIETETFKLFISLLKK